MIDRALKISLKQLCTEELLVQAWKKTASYIRYHNWYADTLELDRAAADLPRFLQKLAKRFAAPEEWINDPLRIVFAPKSQAWQVDPSGRWRPEDNAVKLRPLAHVSLQDQVSATAIMLCLADRVETEQGDTRGDVHDPSHRKRVVSYGNRLFCEAGHRTGSLQHRWGSAQVYRSYFQDYRKFLSRPEAVAEKATTKQSVIIVHSDLRQFYDRVQPRLLAKQMKKLRRPGDDPGFFKLAASALTWQWHGRDRRSISAYARSAGLEDFSVVALPQGLVAGGFFANVALHDFDDALRASFNKRLIGDCRLLDVCRYVDDLRIVIRAPFDTPLDTIEHSIVKWLNRLLAARAPGLEVSADKTKASRLRGDEVPLLQQSRKMERIQKAVSGGFDAVAGEEILDSVQGLIRAQNQFTERRLVSSGWRLQPLPDVRDATVARFAAGRFRSTYRSLRPLLEQARSKDGDVEEEDHPSDISRMARTREELDEEAKIFALGLVAQWVEDPSNVRLLRIGLDLWPATDVLDGVLKLLRPYTREGGPRGAPQSVAWYCLAEILRAGATETGIVRDDECLPAGIDIKRYRDLLAKEAVRLLSRPSRIPPWYVRQQAYLFLAAFRPEKAHVQRISGGAENAPYQELILFLQGKPLDLNGRAFALWSIISRRSFLDRNQSVRLARQSLTSSRLEQIAARDPAFALEILASKRMGPIRRDLSPRIKADLLLDHQADSDEWDTLAGLVLRDGLNNPLRNEISILEFALLLLDELDGMSATGVILPTEVKLQMKPDGARIAKLEIVRSDLSGKGSLYQPPGWCDSGQQWRFQLGYLLRFILTAHCDITAAANRESWKEESRAYRPLESHWYQRLYGLFNGRTAFGDEWIPISEWTERLLFSLLRWPGCPVSEMREVESGLKATRDCIKARLDALVKEQKSAGGIMLLRERTSRPDAFRKRRPLRACVVQTILPFPGDGGGFPPHEAATRDSLTLSDPAFRRRHRSHLSSVLAAVDRMLHLRETHRPKDGRLDWLILPELSVHPDDIATHLIPFARAHKTLILAGSLYQARSADEPLVNSAIWIIPHRTRSHGLQIRHIRQGKLNLSPMETPYNDQSPSGPLLQGYRPCQWLVGYEWSDNASDVPLWLSASICYDATDLSLATALRNRSDVFAIPSLNRDVKTFDHMALALHYHMFQLVIVANNGSYGGSNAYSPYKEEFTRQVFHVHGQPQATISFLEIDNIERYLARSADARNTERRSAGESREPAWKFPPAGAK